MALFHERQGLGSEMRMIACFNLRLLGFKHQIVISSLQPQILSGSQVQAFLYLVFGGKLEMSSTMGEYLKSAGILVEVCQHGW